MDPLVSVICLCYNHDKFVEEALRSVFSQTYENIEVIIIDDYSKDNSVAVIQNVIKNRPGIKFIKNTTNIGNCKSFNMAYHISEGEFIIDFATDDVMLPDRIEKQINAFKNVTADYGVLYSDVCDIDEKGEVIKLPDSNAILPSGDIYKELLSRYFISPPSMMIRRGVLDKLGAYDETLSYEDFDFWIRSSRYYKYFHFKETLTLRRIVSNSHSSKFDRRGENKMIASTYKVILKALWLNKSKEESLAAVGRIRYELRHAFYMENFEYVKKYNDLLGILKAKDTISKTIQFLSGIKFPAHLLYKTYRLLK